MNVTVNYSRYIDLIIHEGLSNKEIEQICQKNNLSIGQFINDFSINVALDYYFNRRDYMDCDIAVNGIFAPLVDLGLSSSMMEPAYSIFLAFDDGEYRHAKDDSSVYPSKKYTRPQIEIILRKYQLI